MQKAGINTVKNKRRPCDTFKLSCVTTTCASMCLTLQHHHMSLPSGNQQGRMIDDHLFVYLFSLECSLKIFFVYTLEYCSWHSRVILILCLGKKKSPLIIVFSCFALCYWSVNNSFCKLIICRNNSFTLTGKYISVGRLTSLVKYRAFNEMKTDIYSPKI